MVCETSFTKVTGPHPDLEQISKRVQAKNKGLNHEIVIDSLMTSAFAGTYLEGDRESLILERAQILITNDSYLLNIENEGKHEAKRTQPPDSTWENPKIHITHYIRPRTVEDWAINRVNGDLIFLRTEDKSFYQAKYPDKEWIKNRIYTMHFQGKCTKKKPEKTLF